MGPVIIKKEDSSGTEYVVSALPLGGYVAMLSEKALQEDDALRDTLTKDQLNTFESKPDGRERSNASWSSCKFYSINFHLLFYLFKFLERTFNLNVGGNYFNNDY